MATAGLLRKPRFTWHTWHVPYPDSAADLRQLVSAMRELGVSAAFGVVLGPMPDEVTRLEEAAKTTPALAEALGNARRQRRIEAARQAVRDELGAVGGYEMTDDEVDRFLDPSVMQ